jgi:hypothetical protein
MAMTGISANLPAKTESYEVTRFNALKHGVLSHATVRRGDTNKLPKLLLGLISFLT